MAQAQLRQKTWDRGLLPPRPPRKPLPPGTSLQKVYNILRRSGRLLKHKDLEKITALDDVKDIGRALRTLKERGWLRRIPEKGPDPYWEAKP